jgi:acetyltransferase-like isoleucine patch superfamily enzyme
LGEGAYLGRNVELATALGGDMFIGRDTSVQDNCVFHGDITIGAYCLFGANVMISTTTHRFRDNPAWLIRDQDEAMTTRTARPADYSLPVVIGDDCWIGWGAAIMPGVTIGRGAVVGANSVVSRDIGPYEIHGGVPNRLLSKRLDFTPPSTLSASIESHLPYFYSGFRLRRQERQNSAAPGIAVSQGRAALVLAAGGKNVEIQGMVAARLVILEIQINGRPTGPHKLDTGPFCLSLPVENAGTGPLGAFTLVEFHDVECRDSAALHAGENRYAIQCARIN